MKLKLVYTMLGIQTVALIVGLVLAFDSITKNTNDLFVGAIGLLMFISIFYSLTISRGMEVVKNVKSILKKKQNKKIEDVLKKILKESDKMSKLYELNEVRIEAHKIEAFIDYLNLNKWLFIAVAGYLTSIMFYLLPTSDGTTAIQILSFWVGFTVSTLIVSSWFAANELEIKE